MKTRFIFFLIIISYFLSPTAQEVFASGTANFRLEIINLCGNNTRESGEQCDGSDLGGSSCVSRGYAGGTLSCNSNCTFSTSQCSSSTSPAPTGGGGGGGGGIAPAATGVEFFGRAYPGSRVTILKDGQIAASTIAGSDASFKVTITGVSPGTYLFGVYSEDKKDVKSATITSLVTLTDGSLATVSGVFIAPTATVDKIEVRRGEDVSIFGQTSPNAEVVVKINSGEEFFEKIRSDKDGFYNLSFNTAQLEIGSHSARSKAAISGSASDFGSVARFSVGDKTVLKPEADKVRETAADTNGDGRVNIVDFSVAAYWYKRDNPPASVDLNGDGKVTLVDFSIMAFHWTG